MMTILLAVKQSKVNLSDYTVSDVLDLDNYGYSVTWVEASKTGASSNSILFQGTKDNEERLVEINLNTLAEQIIYRFSGDHNNGSGPESGGFIYSQSEEKYVIGEKTSNGNYLKFISNGQSTKEISFDDLPKSITEL